VRTVRVLGSRVRLKRLSERNGVRISDIDNRWRALGAHDVLSVAGAIAWVPTGSNFPRFVISSSRPNSDSRSSSAHLSLTHSTSAGVLVQPEQLMYC
jgi:hypothetical protein